MRATIPSDATLKAWARLTGAHGAVSGGIEAELKAQGFLPLAQYEVMVELRRAGGTLRPQEIERNLTIPQHLVSRLIDRLEKAGFVKRLPVAGDARGQIVALTEEGREILTRMSPAYGAAIQRHLGDRLGSEIDATQLAWLLERLTPG
jgi:DNA-binding MarR family transcriptional regulator